jgi:hypothetical protein
VTQKQNCRFVLRRNPAPITKWVTRYQCHELLPVYFSIFIENDGIVPTQRDGNRFFGNRYLTTHDHIHILLDAMRRNSVVEQPINQELPLAERFSFLTAVTMQITAFWDVMSCSLVEIYWRFRGMWNLRLQGGKIGFNKRRIRKDMKGSGRGPVWCTIPAFSWKYWGRIWETQSG